VCGGAGIWANGVLANPDRVQPLAATSAATSTENHPSCTAGQATSNQLLRTGIARSAAVARRAPRY